MRSRGFSPDRVRQVILTTAGLLACAAAMLHSAAQDEGKTDRPIEGSLVETATSELVLIEVYVSDRKGRPVRDLTIDEFRLMVDRHSKPIASLEYYEIRPMQPDVGTTAETGAATTTTVSHVCPAVSGASMT